MSKLSVFVLAALVVLPCLPAAGQPATNLITVCPEETDELLANPGMGWETFHHPRQQDKSLPAWLPSTIQYARWSWNDLEPESGRLNTHFLDNELKETHDSGQKLAFRVMCCSTSKGAPYHPQWLKDIGGKELLADYAGNGPFPIPDMDDAVVLKAHLDFIQRLGARYDGHPDLDHVDIGSIGWWGEWHLSNSKKCKLPTLETRMKIVDAYLRAFKKTPLLMLIGDKDCLSYAAQCGAGWRADCLGDMDGFSRSWSHMLKGYPAWIEAAGIQDVWQKAPVAWETCWDMRKWVSEGWSLRSSFNYALACHASYINNKSAPVAQGENVRPELERFLRRLGYRLVLKELKHAAQAKSGTNLAVSMRWQNVGSAPCYKPYRVAVRLTDSSGQQTTMVSDIAVNRWLPGSIPLFTKDFFREPQDLPPGEIANVTASLALPHDLPAGVYTLSLAVVDAQGGQPVVRVGIKGRAQDGWYPLSQVQVVR